MPMAESTKRQLESRIRCLERYREAGRRQLEELEAEPDPLRAWGLYPRRRTPALPSR